MAWDFETDPEYQEKLDWADAFVRSEVEPLDYVWPHMQFVPMTAAMRAAIDPLKQEVRRHGLWATHLGPELGGHDSRKRHDGAFDGAVSGSAGIAARRDRRRHVDQARAALRVVMCEQRLRRPEERLDADVEHRAEPLGLDAFDRRVMQDHRVVDDCVDAPADARKIARNPLIGLAARDVARISERVAARLGDLGGRGAAALTVDVDDADRSAEACEMQGEVPPQAAARAGDQKMLVAEIVSHCELMPGFSCTQYTKAPNDVRTQKCLLRQHSRCR